MDPARDPSAFGMPHSFDGAEQSEEASFGSETANFQFQHWPAVSVDAPYYGYAENAFASAVPVADDTNFLISPPTLHEGIAERH